MLALLRPPCSATEAARLFLVLAVGAGCQEQPVGGEPPRDVRWDSPHFAYYTRTAEAQACPSLLDVLEQNFVAMQSYLGFTWPHERKVEYNKYLDKQDYEAHAPCPPDSGGCARASTVETPQPFDRHELMHAYLAPSGDPPALFKEGLATTLACSPSLSSSSVISWEEALAASDPIKELGVYATGGLLVSYLLGHYPPEQFLRLYRSLDGDAGPDAVDAAIRASYGMSATSAWRQARDVGTDCLPVWPCARPALPLDGSSVMVPGQCGLAADARTLAVPADGNLAVRTPGGVRLSSCVDGTRTSVSPVLSGEAGLLTLLPITAGTYFVDYAAAAGLRIEASMLAGPAVGTDCAALTPYVVGADAPTEIALLAPSPTDGWVARLRIVGPRALHLSTQPSDDAATTRLTLCPACDLGSALCQTVDVGLAGLDVLWDGDYVVAVGSPAPRRLALELHLTAR